MPGGSPRDVRVLVLAASGGVVEDRDEVRRWIAEDIVPDRMIAEDTLDATSFTERDLEQVAGLRGRLLRRLPLPFALAVEVWRRRHDYDVVLCWGEWLAFPLAAVLSLTRHRRLGHIAILMRPFGTGSPLLIKRIKRSIKHALFGPLARHGIDRMWVPAPLQQRFAIDEWRVPADRMVPVHWSVDTRFWRPMGGAQDMICSAGREMRDYATLVDALRGLDIPCHIAAGTTVLSGRFGTDDPQATSAVSESLPPGLTIGPKSSADLRELYASSRIVVVPIVPSQSDNGVTTVLEAMAMGRAVISTETEGKADILRDDVTCVLVPPGDPVALRGAIEGLWRDPDRRARLGAEARKRVESAYGIDQWLSGVRDVAAELASARAAGR